MKKRRKQYSAGAIIWIIFKYVSLVFFSFVAVIPIISCVITAFKTEEEYKTTNVMTLPQNWSILTTLWKRSSVRTWEGHS